MDEAFEVGRIEFPAGHEPPELHQPGEEALNLPTTLVATELATILSTGAHAARSMRRDELGAQLELELLVESVAVVSLVADQDVRGFFNEARVEGVDDELALMSCTACSPGGDRKAIAVCHCHDLGRFAAASDPNIKAPLFAPA